MKDKTKEIIQRYCSKNLMPRLVMEQFFIKYKELILYTIFGFITTFINICIFSVLYQSCSFPLLFANSAAWAAAFLFSLLSNKLWVFGSKNWKSRAALKEFLGFLLARLSTFLLDTAVMWFLVDVLGVYGVFSKAVSNVIMILLNYIASKFWIFRAGKES